MTYSSLKKKLLYTIFITVLVVSLKGAMILFLTDIGSPIS